MDKEKRESDLKEQNNQQRFMSVKNSDKLNGADLVKFGDDQDVNYSTEVIQVQKSNKKINENLDFSDDQVASGEGTKEKNEDINVKSQNVDSAQLPKPDLLVPNSERRGSSKSIGSKPDLDDDDPYGLGSGQGNKAADYNKEELEALQTNLLDGFSHEFKDSLTIVENLPRGTILLSSIQSCLMDDNKLVKRGILDMVNNYLKLDDDLLLSEDQKVELIQTMMYLLLRRDLSVTRRIYGWFFGDPDADNNYVIDETKTNVLKYIVLAFSKIFNTFVINTEDPKNSSTPLKILQNFYMDHEKSIDLTIGKIALPMIKFIYMKGIKNKDEKIKEEISKSGIRFLSCVTSHFHLIVEEISKAISVANNADLKIYSGIIKYIKDCFSNPELQISELRVEVRLLEGLTSFLLKIRIGDIIENYLDNNYDHMKLTLKVLKIFVEIIDYMFGDNTAWSIEELKQMIMSLPAITNALDGFERDFTELCKVLSSFKVGEILILR